jgi:methionine aminopeptidase
VSIGAVRPEIQRLLDVTSETLNLAIRAMERCRYWSEVASMMERFVKSQGYYVVEKFVGHGIGREMHEDPQVPNFVSQALREHDIQLEPGVVLAIEPMVAVGTKEVRTLHDGWTVETRGPARADLPGRLRAPLTRPARRPARPPGIVRPSEIYFRVEGRSTLAFRGLAGYLG